MRNVPCIFFIASLSHSYHRNSELSIIQCEGNHGNIVSMIKKTNEKKPRNYYFFFFEIEPSCTIICYFCKENVMKFNKKLLFFSSMKCVKK